MSPQPDYTIVRMIHENRWDDGLQDVVAGWTLRVRDLQTNTYVPVFVPGDVFTEDGARQYIEAALTTVRQVARLGTQTTTA